VSAPSHALSLDDPCFDDIRAALDAYIPPCWRVGDVIAVRDERTGEVELRTIIAIDSPAPTARPRVDVCIWLACLLWVGGAR